MDPWLEHPALWPDFHNRLIAATADVLTPLVAPRYYVALEQRTYVLLPDEIAFIGCPDLSVAPAERVSPRKARRAQGPAVLEIEVPMPAEVRETYLEVRQTGSGSVVAVIELLSPANKVHAKGRQEYEAKRNQVFGTRIHLVEIDLMRAGLPMPALGRIAPSDYRIVVSRGDRRPRANLYAFGVRESIPTFPLPLFPGDAEPEVDLGAIVHGVYERARFDLRLDYKRPPVLPLSTEDSTWAGRLTRKADRSQDGPGLTGPRR